jgi:hypothetical protein
MLEPDETGLVLWGGIDFDLTLRGLSESRCDVCGAPATVAVRRLDEQERRFLCSLHREPR